jgi:orotidine-5'-phosphate decarboxylase
MDGVVASPMEVGMIRDNIGNGDFLVVTPGVRPTFATFDDQKRVMTPGEAVAAGSDYLVIGRPITKAQNMGEAVHRILHDIEISA